MGITLSRDDPTQSMGRRDGEVEDSQAEAKNIKSQTLHTHSYLRTNSKGLIVFLFLFFHLFLFFLFQFILLFLRPLLPLPDPPHSLFLLLFLFLLLLFLFLSFLQRDRIPSRRTENTRPWAVRINASAI